MSLKVAVFFMILSCVSSLLDESIMFYSTPGGKYYTRVLCDYTFECSFIADNVFWSFNGVTSPITNTSTRIVYGSSALTLQNSTVQETSLVFSPVLESHEAVYACNVVTGQSSAAYTFDLFVNENIIGITVDNYDVSINHIGDTVMLEITIETCLSNLSVSIYKDKDRLYNGVINNNRQTSFNVQYPLQVVDNTSAGLYSVRAYSDSFTTPLHFFNITGTPLID